MKKVKSEASDIVSILDEFVSDHKKELIDEVLRKRTRHLTLVFEDIDKPHNISAVLRTAECLGIQDVHFIKNKNEYSINPTITQGAAKWLTLHHYNSNDNNVESCFNYLRSNGYQILATSLHEKSKSVEEINPESKTAIVFGTESDGISKEAGDLADGFIHIPMSGFTESFNLSVSAALCMNTLKFKGDGFPSISDKEKLVLRGEWYRKIVREADMILRSKGVEV